MLKRILRRTLLGKLRRQPKATRLARSQSIARTLRRSLLYRRARRILCYVAFDGEVETGPIIRQALKEGKQVAVPVVQKGKRLIAAQISDPEKELKTKGPLGVHQPKKIRRMNPKNLDLILVPGIAFDRKGRRLGRGGGYFDRFLERLPKRIPTIGLAFRFQVVKKLPIESHDQPVDRVLTER